MSGQHTPGPWYVHPDSPELVRREDDDATIADALEGGHPDFEDFDAATRKANARLMAAAPDVLNALKEMSAILDELFNAKGRALKYAETQAKWVKRARIVMAAAIAKAEGRS